MATSAQPLRTKVWKWVYLILQKYHPSHGLLAVPRFLAGQQEFVFVRAVPRGGPWAVHGVLSAGEGAARLARGEHIVEMAALNGSEVRSLDAVAWLERAMRLDEVDDAEKYAALSFIQQAHVTAADYLKTWNLIGLYAAKTGAHATTTFPESCDESLTSLPRTAPFGFRVGELTVLSTGIIVNNALVAVDVDEDFGLESPLAGLLFASAKLQIGDPLALGRSSPLLAELDVAPMSVTFVPGAEDQLVVGARKGGLSWLQIGLPPQPIGESESCLHATFWGEGSSTQLLSPEGFAWRWPELAKSERLPPTFAGTLPHRSSLVPSGLVGTQSALWRVLDDCRLQVLAGSPPDDAPSWTEIDGMFVDVASGGAASLCVDRGSAVLISAHSRHIAVELPSWAEQKVEAAISGGHPAGGAVSARLGLLAVFSREIALVDLDEGVCIADLRITSPGKIAGAFSPDGRFLVFVASGLLLVMKPFSRICRIFGGVEVGPDQDPLVVFSPNGTRLAVGGAKLRVFDWTALLERWSIFPRVPIHDGLFGE